MAYKALYRRFRPRRFSELKGQDNISAVLKNQIISGKTSHAYLFSGPRGTGKTSTAKILACALNCTDLRDGEPCLECENCIAALNDNMPDIVEMDAASNNSVENARELREKVSLLPVKGKHKVYIIDEVHMLSNSAFNALLKTIEEPPEYSVFILATTELRKLPKTILSRCQRFEFKSIADNSMLERMQEVLKEVGATAEEDALLAISQAAEGGMRDALSILDKCITTTSNITVKTVSEVLNLTDLGAISMLTDYIYAYDSASALSLLNDLIDEGSDPSDIISRLIYSFRNSLVNSVIDGREANKEDLLRNIEILCDAEIRMKQSTKPAIILETAIFRMLLPQAEGENASLVSVIHKLESELKTLKEKGVALIAQENQVQQVTEVKKPVRKKKTVIPSVSPDDAELFNKLLDYFKEKDMAWFTFVNKLTFIGSSNGKISFTGEASLLRMMSEEPAVMRLKEALKQLTGRDFDIDIVMPKEDSYLEGIFEGVEILD